ncbi:hypothetical protein [uncultured Zhongshania sp.]|uniref:hypothetical protein n=1 Tax=uncultured Zhongshania sp. TaxID=1642288 RepID=UPI0025DB20F5|nr:hypothetical protein [uncultured Zhongshania sp.]
MKKTSPCLLLLSTALLSASVFANVTPAWKIDELSHSTGYTVTADNQASHHFGLVKHSNTCGSDELYLTWTSSSPDVWSLAGKTVTMDANFDGVSVSLPLEVVAIKPGAGNNHKIIMGHVFANTELLDLMTHSDAVNVLVPSTDAMSRHLNTNSDRFSMRGFNEAREQALSRCYSKSSLASN